MLSKVFKVIGIIQAFFSIPINIYLNHFIKENFIWINDSFDYTIFIGLWCFALVCTQIAIAWICAYSLKIKL